MRRPRPAERKLGINDIQNILALTVGHSKGQERNERLTTYRGQYTAREGSRLERWTLWE